jgi:hypothetical protein
VGSEEQVESSHKECLVTHQSRTRHAEADPSSVAVAVLADPDPSLLGKDVGVDAGRTQQVGRGRGRIGA